MNKYYEFGWVSANVASNFAANSSWKSTGTKQEADAFFDQTREQAENDGLVWFFLQID